MRRARRALKRRLDLAVRRTRVARESERRAVPREIVHRARASPSVVARRAGRGGRGDRPRPTARSYARAVTMYLSPNIRAQESTNAPIEMTPNVRTRDVIRAAADKARATRSRRATRASHRRARPPDDRTETHARPHTSLIMHASHARARRAKFATTTSQGERVAIDDRDARRRRARR